LSWTRAGAGRSSESQAEKDYAIDATEISTREIYWEKQDFQGLSATRSEKSVDKRPVQLDTCVSSELLPSPPMPRTAATADRTKLYRQRLRAAGGEEVLFQLPRETVALLDELKERQGLRSRSQALMQLIEHGRQPPSR
jgi:Ribbon-helix-helix protein, copG family